MEVERQVAGEVGGDVVVERRDVEGVEPGVAGVRVEFDGEHDPLVLGPGGTPSAAPDGPLY